MAADIGLRGWSTHDVAKRAQKSHRTINNFLDGQFQTNKTAKAIADALGYETERYLLRVEISAA